MFRIRVKITDGKYGRKVYFEGVRPHAYYVRWEDYEDFIGKHPFASSGDEALILASRDSPRLTKGIKDVLDDMWVTQESRRLFSEITLSELEHKPTKELEEEYDGLRCKYGAPCRMEKALKNRCIVIRNYGVKPRNIMTTERGWTHLILPREKIPITPKNNGFFDKER